jgi:drug/metabolite transporter superfamily protein YnfA
MLGLFVVTAVAEIVGCYLPYLWPKRAAPAWLLPPAAASLALFVWLWAVAVAGMAIITLAPRSP